mgnify:CR=1 FL=1
MKIKRILREYDKNIFENNIGTNMVCGDFVFLSYL